MGVTTKYGTGYKDPAATVAVLALYAEGNICSIVSKVSVEAGDDSASLHYFGRVPSQAIILRGGALEFGAVTGLTDYDLGFYLNGVECVTGSGDNLVNGEDVHLAGSISPSKAVVIGDIAKKAWELAGYTVDPGGMLDIVGKCNADPSAGADIALTLLYAK